MYVSKKWLSIVGAIAFCSAACASADPGSSQEKTGQSTAAQVIAPLPAVAPIPPLACTPLLTADTSLLSCGASAAAQLDIATSVQSTLSADLQTAFANLSLEPSWNLNQVIITSKAAEFGTFFGPQIVAPLVPSGFFTASIPLAGLAPISPDLNLVANIFGMVPAQFLPPVAPALLPFGGTVANAQFSAFNASTFSASNTAFNQSIVTGATLPLTFFISTPIATTLPLTCAGSIPLGCL